MLTTVVEPPAWVTGARTVVQGISSELWPAVLVVFFVGCLIVVSRTRNYLVIDVLALLMFVVGLLVATHTLGSAGLS